MANGRPGASADSVYKQLESAYNAFMLELGGSSNEAQRRVFMAAQQPWDGGKDYATVHAEHRQRIDDAWKDVDLTQRYLNALKDYKSAVEKVMANTDVHALDSIALMAWSQTFHHIAMYGYWLNDPGVLGKGDTPSGGAERIEPDPSRKPTPPAAPPK
ncbi:hypothetical protein [Myxococcus faecalis]|uniref:hypothetical protein n=1 Tax=Myxococcus faecalis TaxID=3115646 RepID=UPI003CF40237